MELFKNNKDLKNNEMLRINHRANEVMYGALAPYKQWTDEFLNKWEDDLVYHASRIKDKSIPTVTKEYAHEILTKRIEFFECGIVDLEKSQLKRPSKRLSQRIEEHYNKEIFTGIQDSKAAYLIVSSHMRHSEYDYDERRAEAYGMYKEINCPFNFKEYARATMMRLDHASFTKVEKGTDGAYRLVRKIGNLENAPISGRMPDFEAKMRASINVDEVAQEYINDPDEAMGLCRGVAVLESHTIAEGLNRYLRNKTLDGIRKGISYQNLNVPLNSREYVNVMNSVQEIYQSVLLEAVEERVIEIQGTLQKPVEQTETISEEHGSEKKIEEQVSAEQEYIPGDDER